MAGFFLADQCIYLLSAARFERLSLEIVNVMPVLRITSLAFENEDSSGWAAQVCEHFAKATEIPVRHISATWQLLMSGHYSHHNQSPAFQPRDSHPLIIEIMLPDFYAVDRVEKIIFATVDAVSLVANMPRDNIFVQVNRARAGSVFDEGKIVRW